MIKLRTIAVIFFMFVPNLYAEEGIKKKEELQSGIIDCYLAKFFYKKDEFISIIEIHFSNLSTGFGVEGLTLYKSKDNKNIYSSYYNSPYDDYNIRAYVYWSFDVDTKILREYVIHNRDFKMNDGIGDHYFREVELQGCKLTIPFDSIKNRKEINNE